MVRRLFTAALVAGVLSGTAASVVQQATTVPLILEAEKYEVLAQPPSADGHQHAPVRNVGDGVPVTTGEAMERVGLTIVANLLAGVGYALLVGGVMLLVGRPVDARRGLVWGAGGFVAFALAPAFGLPPELPGMAGAALEARQMWWLAAALCAGGGLLAMAFARHRLAVAAGVVVAALPHLVGAPHPETIDGAVPPELAAHFVTSSLGAAALFWAVLGAVCGWLMSGLLVGTTAGTAAERQSTVAPQAGSR
ncbi:cobalt transporter [Azospirillum sp. TSO35-2]|nr:cobalt transporter [Azospirillum sp. TSO35-2]